MKKQFELIATAAAGVEAVVGRELRDLGYDCCALEMDGFDFRRPSSNHRNVTSGCERLIEWKLWLGLFQPKPSKNSFKGVFALDWENYLPFRSTFFLFLRLNVSNQNFIMNLAFRPFRKSQWLKSYKTLCPARRCSSSWKMGQSSRSKYRS